MKNILSALIFIGLVIVFVLPDFEPAPASLDGVSLGEYGKLSKQARQDLISSQATAVGAEAEDVELFIACMGEFAATKSANLDALTVFGWCDVERTMYPDQFASHFNELDAPDLSSAATVACRNFIRDETAFKVDFPWVPDYLTSLGRHKYSIRSHVTVTNAYGAEIRHNYACEITYDGEGATELPESWTLDHLSTYMN